MSLESIVRANLFLFFFPLLLAFNAINPGLVEAIVWTAAKHNNGVRVNKARIKCQEISRRAECETATASVECCSHTRPGCTEPFPLIRARALFSGGPLDVVAI